MILDTLLVLATTEMSTERRYLMYAAMACAIVLLTISMRRRRAQGYGTPRLRPRQRAEEESARRGMRDDMEQLLAELQDLSRKISAQIDTKFAKLEAAIADADRRIDALQRLSRAAEGRPTVDVIVSDETPSLRPDKATVSESAPGRHAAVYELHDAGKTPVEIAQALGRTPGEVELILALRPLR